MFLTPRMTARLGDDRIDRLGGIDSGKALLYLMRRFGFTPFGSDRYKDVCAYYVNTDMEGLYLSFRIGGDITYIHMVSDQVLLQKIVKARLSWWGRFLTWFWRRVMRKSEYELPIVRRCYDAAENALRDLMRPVFVQDVPINLLGTAEEYLGEYDEGQDRHKNEVERCPYSGYGVPDGCYANPDLFIEFMQKVKELGDGEMEAGIRSALKLINGKSENED